MSAGMEKTRGRVLDMPILDDLVKSRDTPYFVI